MSEHTGAVAQLPVSVIVLTRDEEANIAACLESVRWAGEVFVVDCLSTDRTVEIAKSLGARIYLHPFEGYAKQRNWALASLPLSSEWVLLLDADERVPAALAEEIGRVMTHVPSGYAGFFLKFRFYFLGRWLKHGGLYPTWVLRLFKRRAGRFEERPMNEHVILAGTAGYLECPFDHRDQRPLSDWIAKHNRYADLEAEEYLREKSGEGYARSIPARFWGRQAERKRWLKLHIWNRLPLLLRPFLFFLRNYFWKGGFLDGKPGFIYHLLWSFWYPLLISAKILERQKAARETAAGGQALSDRGRGEAAGIAGAANSVAPAKEVRSAPSGD
jgi:glycosyltransferase involved in cell wall biosynthesis